MNKQINRYKQQVRTLLLLFIIALIISGVTAIPVHAEIKFLLNTLPADKFITPWLQQVFTALDTTQKNFPFLLYGYDWLAFGHIVIATAFVGPLKNPVKNIWVVEFGMLACILVLPAAFVFSALRGIPYWWTLIDFSFGVLGFIPLWICRRKILQLEKLIEKDKLNIIF